MPIRAITKGNARPSTALTLPMDDKKPDWQPNRPPLPHFYPPDPQPSPRMVSSLPASSAEPAPPFHMPLLDGPDQMLPPILPAKRTFQDEVDWSQPPQSKMRVARPIRTTTPPAVTYALHRRDVQVAQPVPQTQPQPQPQQAVRPPEFATRGGGYGVKGVEGVYEGSGLEGGVFREGKTSEGMGRTFEGVGMTVASSTSTGINFGGVGAPVGARSRRVSACDDSFVIAAETGARAQCAVDNASGEGVFETYDLGITIVQSSKLYANQRRSNRLLPGGSDSTTAACYMIGGTPDSVLSPLLARVNPCDPREERCKAVERVLKDKTRGAICALNGENPREARADNLAAVRICEVVADILVAFSAKRLFESRKQLFATVARQEETIRELRGQVEEGKREIERLKKEVDLKELGEEEEQDKG